MHAQDDESPIIDLDFSLAAPYRVPAIGLIFAFLLELAMFICLAIWGWHLGDGGFPGGFLAALFVVIAGGIWGLCRAPGDLPRGQSRVPVPGPVRLLIEFTVLGLATYGIWAAGSRAAGETLLTAGVVHYALTWERVRWLLQSPRSGADAALILAAGSVPLKSGSRDKIAAFETSQFMKEVGIP